MFEDELINVRSHVAALGAWITVLAIAIDPFSQQIIHPVVCHETLQGVVASVPRANNLTGIGTLTARYEPMTLDGDTTTAILLGLLRDPELVPVQCSTGNCTFSSDAASGATYQTLGFGSACVDISAEIKRNDNTSSATPEWYIPAMDKEAAQLANNTLRATGQFPALTTDNTYFPAYWSGNRGNTSLFAFTALLRESECKNNLNQSCVVPLAVECKMWPVIQTISSRIEISKLQEEVLSSEPLNRYTADGWTQTPYDYKTITSRVLRNGNWESCDTTRSSDCVWSIDAASVSALSIALRRMFDKQYIARGAYGGGRIQNGELWIRNLFHNGTASLSTAEKYTDQLARALTTHVRQRASLQNPELGFAHGSTVKTETCIQIRWGWISFPTSLVLFTIVFLAATIVKTKKSDHVTRQHGHWKSSSLALLFGGLEDDLRHGTRALEKRSDMEESARLLKVSLSPGDDGWRLR